MRGSSNDVHIHDDRNGRDDVARSGDRGDPGGQW